MRLVSDTREQSPLHFPLVNGVEYVVGTLSVGDYSASYVIGGKTVESASVIERKEKGDLFSSYTSGYERERAKFLRAKEANKTFILAIEGTAAEILRGHTYVKGGIERESKKDGMTMLRQLLSCANKYGIQLWFCSTKNEMAILTQEYFLAEERMLLKQYNQKTESEGQK
jgi:ERCC4-type nuclease